MSPHPKELVAEARQQWLADEHEAALVLFRTAMKQDLSDLRLAVEAASYLGMRFEVDEAKEILSRCERELSGNVEGLYQVGLAYDRAFSPDDALRCFQQVVRVAPTHFRAWLRIAEWFDRRGLLAEAMDAIETSAGDVPEVEFAQARLLYRLGDNTKAETLLEKLVSREGITEDLSVQIWFKLAEIYDVDGRASLAFEAASAAKQRQRHRANAPLRQARDLAKLEANFVTTVTPDHYRRWAATAHHPVGLLTGPPRSGTTLMARALGHHESILLGDEINAYATYSHRELLRGLRGTNVGNAMDGIDGAHVAQCQSRYLRWMYAAIGRQPGPEVLLDKNPSTTFLIPAFRRLFPESTIVMAIRDPRDVVISCYLQLFPLNPVSAMFTRLDLAVMRCRAEVEAWLRVRENLTQPWSAIRYEDLAAGNAEVLRSTLIALKVDWQDDLLSFQAGLRTQAVRSPTYAQLFEPPHTKRIGRWKLYEKQLSPFLPQLEPLCKQLGYE